MELVLEKHIVKTANIRGGKACLVGTRIAVSDIVIWHFRHGESLDEIGAIYDLSLSAVYAALSYYFDHKQEIDDEIENGRVAYEKLKAASPFLIQQKLVARKHT